MKRFALLLVLAIAGISSVLSQTIVTEGAADRGSRTENMFNRQRPGSLKNRFDFYLLDGNRLSLEVNYIGQLQQLTNLDSLLKRVWLTLQPFSDSFSKPLVSRRIDYYQNAVDIRLRFLEYPQAGNLFRIKSGDTAQLKMEQDTLRITLLTNRHIKSAKKELTISQPYYVTLYLNNITNLPSLQASDLEWALTTLKNDLKKNLYASPSKQYSQRYYASYNVVEQKRITPAKDLNGFDRQTEFVPYVQVGLQYVKGGWAPSAGLGAEVIRQVRPNRKQHFQLFWEPYFFFHTDNIGKVVTDRNDFITFKYRNDFEGTEKHVADNISFSYLFRRKGVWFEENTFKFSFPGLRFQSLFVEPEFYFNDFFRHFTPALKVTLAFQ